MIKGIFVFLICVLLFSALAGCKGKASGNAAGKAVPVNDSLAGKAEDGWRSDRKFCEVVRRYDSTFTVYSQAVRLLDNQYLYIGVGSFIQESIVRRLRTVKETDDEIQMVCDTIAYWLFEEELHRLKGSESALGSRYQGDDTLYLRRMADGLWDFDGTELVEASELPRARFRRAEDLYEAGPFEPMEQLPRLFYSVDFRSDGFYVDTNIQFRLQPHLAVIEGETGMPVQRYETDAERKVIRGVPEECRGERENEFYYPHLLLTDENRYIWKSLYEMDMYWVDSADLRRVGLANVPSVAGDNQGMQLVTDFYRQYISLNAVEKPDWNRLDSLKRKHCTLRLLQEIADLEPDYDPWLQAQDCDGGWLENLTVSRETPDGNIFLVRFKPEEEEAIRVLVTKEDGIYRIDGVNNVNGHQ